MSDNYRTPLWLKLQEISLLKEERAEVAAKRSALTAKIDAIDAKLAKVKREADEMK